MRESAQDNAKLLKKVLKVFFNQKEINEFYRHIKPNETTKNELYQNVSVEANFQQQIDLLVTYAGSKLPNDQFLNLLIHLGQLSITLGEFSASLNIFEILISHTNNKSGYENFTANALLSMSEVYSRQALWESSIKCIRSAEKLFVELNDKKGKSSCWNMLGTIFGERGKLKKAAAYFEKSLALLNSKKDYALAGKIEINLGILNDIQENFDESAYYYQRALINFEKIKDAKRVAEIQHNLGMLYTKRGNYNKAISMFDQSIRTSEKISYVPNKAFSLLGKAHIWTKIGDYSSAENFANQSLDLFHKLNDKLSIAEVYKIKGIIQRNRRSYKESENYLLTSLRINKELGNEMNEAETSYELGILYKSINRIEESKELFVSALNYYKRIKANKSTEGLQSLLAS